MRSFHKNDIHNLVFGRNVMPFCKYCGAPHDADAIFCTECGNKIKTATKQEQKEPLIEPTETVEQASENQIYLPGDPITPEMNERIIEYKKRVFKFNLSLTCFKKLFKENPESFGQNEWELIEDLLAKKYGISDISVYRQKKLPNLDEEVIPVTYSPSKKHKSYNKKDTEYWSKFKKEG